jgi:hypothetical protein
MRHIWICLIDGVIVRSGPIQPTDTMPIVLEKLMRVYPHMQTDSLKVIREDGLIFDSELSFSNPSPNDPNRADVDDILAAVGVVEGHLGVQIYHGKSPEDILTTEASNFPEKITEQMDFGIFNFAGDQLVSIEDVITFLGPKNVQEFQPRDNNQQRSGGGGGNRGDRDRGRRGRNRRPLRRRGGRGGGPEDRGNNQSQGSSGQSDTSNPPHNEGQNTGSEENFSSSDSQNQEDRGGDDRGEDSHFEDRHEGDDHQHNEPQNSESSEHQSSSESPIEPRQS